MRHVEHGQTGAPRSAGASPEAWRERRLVDTGFPRGLAARLARDVRYDVHALIELVERGCPPDLAARILTPLDGEDTR